MAALNINDYYNIITYIVRKNRGGFVSPEDACLALNRGCMELLSDSFAQFQINQKIVDALSPFKVQMVSASASDGQVTMPSDYLHLLGGCYTIYGSTVNPIHFVNPDELPDRLTSQLRPVTLSTPIAIDSALGFQIYPNAVQTVFYTYLRQPATAFLAYTYIDRVFTYLPNASTQIEFYDIYANNIISRALKYVGINLDEAAVSQFAQVQQQETN